MTVRNIFLDFECKNCIRAKDIYWKIDGKDIRDPDFIMCQVHRHMKRKYHFGCRRLASKKEVQNARTQTLSN